MEHNAQLKLDLLSHNMSKIDMVKSILINSIVYKHFIATNTTPTLSELIHFNDKVIREELPKIRTGLCGIIYPINETFDLKFFITNELSEITDLKCITPMTFITDISIQQFNEKAIDLGNGYYCIVSLMVND